MASLWKRSSSRFWFACFKDHTGKKRKVSTKETDKKRAMRMAETFEQAYFAARTSAQMQKVMAGIHRDLTGETIKPVSVREYRERWMASKKAEGCADSTIVFLKHSTKRFLDHLGPDADKPLASITREQIEGFRNVLAETLASKTVNHQVKGLRMMLKAAMQSGLVTDNPALTVRTINAKRTAPTRKAAFTLDQIRHILPHCDDEWRSMVLFALYTGQRLADLQNLQWSGIAADGSMIELVTRKTGRSMKIPTAAPLRAHILSLPRPDDSTGPVHPKLAALKANTLSGRFLDILISAGIRTKGTAGARRDHSQLSFHSLRHSAVTMLKEAGVPLATVMAMVGHDSEAMSENYTKVGAASMTAAAAAFPEI